MTAKIMVDADACPVKREIAAAARQFGAEVVLVASYAHRLEPEEGVRVVQVDPSDQSADLYIANQLAAGDILVTQDYGLAAVGLAKQAVVLSNRGQVYTAETIDFLLEHRHEQARRRRGGSRTRGPKPIAAADRLRFQQTLTKVLKRLQENFIT
jgi:hypothetical protein